MSRRRSRHLSSRGGDAADPCEREAGRDGRAHEQRWLAPSQAAEVAQQALQIIVAQRGRQGRQFVGALLHQLGYPVLMSLKLFARPVSGFGDILELFG